MLSDKFEEIDVCVIMIWFYGQWVKIQICVYRVTG